MDDARDEAPVVDDSASPVGHAGRQVLAFVTAAATIGALVAGMVLPVAWFATGVTREVTSAVASSPRRWTYGRFARSTILKRTATCSPTLRLEPGQRAARRGVQNLPEGAARCRGLAVLRAQRHRPAGHPPGTRRERAVGLGRAGRFEPHPAAGQADPGHPGTQRRRPANRDRADRGPQGARARVGDRARAGSLQGLDPGALRQHRLLRGRRLRVQAAAEHYFGIDAADLDLRQSALLAGSSRARPATTPPRTSVGHASGAGRSSSGWPDWD